MKYAYGFTALAMALTAAASNALADGQIVYQADNYTIRYESPRYCTLELATPEGSIISMANNENEWDDEGSWQTLAFANAAFPAIPKDRTIPILLQYDGEAQPSPFIAEGYTHQDSGARGFQSIADTTLFQNWRKGNQVAIRLGDDKKSLIELVSLKGSANAINNLIACSGEDFTPTPPATPYTPVSDAGMPSGPVTGDFEVTCNTAKGTSAYYWKKVVIGNGPACGEGWEPDIRGAKTFAGNRSLYLVQQGGGGMASSGDIIMIAPGLRPAIVHVDYMSEFEAIASDARVKVFTQGVMDTSGPTCNTAITYTLNWKRLTATERKTGQSGSCG